MDEQVINPAASQLQETARVAQSAQSAQLDLFDSAESAPRFQVALADEVERALQCAAPVFMAVSGGKDSQALAHRVCEYLDVTGHQGPLGGTCAARESNDRPRRAARSQAERKPLRRFLVANSIQLGRRRDVSNVRRTASP